MKGKSVKRKEKKVISNKNTNNASLKQNYSINKQSSSNTSLEDKASGGVSPRIEKEKVIEKLVSELNVPDTYKRTEKKLKKQLLDEEDALELGVKPNNYYSAKEKEDEEDSLGGEFEESSGSFGHRSNTTH